MKIVVVSDSHGRIDLLRQVFEFCEKENIQEVFHLGDFAVIGVENLFSDFSNIHFFIAQGNCDVNVETLELLSSLKNVSLQETFLLDREGRRFSFSHIPGVAEKKHAHEEIFAFLHGDTHKIEARKKNGIYFLNPGALTDQESFFVITLPQFCIEVKFCQDLTKSYLLKIEE